MVKVAPTGQPLLGTIAKGHAGKHLEVAGTPLVFKISLVLSRQLRNGLQTLVVGGVRGQPIPLPWRGAPLGLRQIGGEPFLVFEYIDHIDHVARIEACARQIFSPQPVGLQLLVAPVRSDETRRHRL